MDKPQKHYARMSLVVQWIRIHLPRQGTWVQSLVWEDYTCRWPTKPMYLGFRALLKAVYPGAHAPQRETTTIRSPCTATREQTRLQQVKKSLHNNKDSAQPKINKKQEKKKFQTLCKKDGCIKPTGDIPVLHCHEHAQLDSKHGKNHEGSSPKR